MSNNLMLLGASVEEPNVPEDSMTYYKTLMEQYPFLFPFDFRAKFWRLTGAGLAR